MRSKKGAEMLKKDFFKQNKVMCPAIKQPNKAENDYILTRAGLMQVKILEALEKVADLSFENRKFLYSLTKNKKLNYKVRAKAIEVYDKLEILFRKQEGK